MNLKVLLARGRIIGSAYINTLKAGEVDNKTVLIVFQQIFGDSIVIQSSLNAYTELFPRACGYKLIFLARPSVLSFMKETLPLPDEITYEPCDFKKFLEDYKYFKEIVGKYKDVAGTVIVPGTSLSAEIFSSCMLSKRKIGLIRSIDVTKPKIMAYFYKHAYTEIIRPEKNDMMLQRHRKLLNFLGNKEYKSSLPEILEKEEIITSRYAVMCPGSSKEEKCWPIDRFAEVVNYLNEKYNLPVHLCGGTDEKKYETELIQRVRNRDKVISHIGNTSFSDWSAIVQHADIVVGNDSATLHLAAAARVSAVCIAGVYDKNQFFPYKVDELNSDDKLPITVLHDMNCEWCRTIGYDAGYGNKECKKRINAGLCSICIDLITVDEVKAAIDGLLKESNVT